jgi:hypothetical protein
VSSPTATRTQISIERRFNGPLSSANGGYACGRVAELVDGPAEVTLRRPVPLDTPLDVERHDDGSVTMHHDGLLLAEGNPALPLDLGAAAPALGGRGRRSGPRRLRGPPGGVRDVLRLRPRPPGRPGRGLRPAALGSDDDRRRAAGRLPRAPARPASSRPRSPGPRSIARATRRRCGSGRRRACSPA